MQFRHDEDGRVLSEVRLGVDFESFPGVIHGGIVATVLDEVMARASLHAHRVPSMTVGLRMRYVQVARTDQLYLASAEVLSRDGDLARVQGRLEGMDSRLVAVADATFILLDAERIDGQLSLPTETVESFNRYMQKVT
jgi:acyl-coenzyme A thioesterase PaaI-like protein